MTRNEPSELLAVANAAIDGVEESFRAGLGAAPTHFKGQGDFATEVDLAIEKRLCSFLTESTGIPVVGEEDTSGKVPAGETPQTVWVVDPVDGTANFSAGNPLCGILIALIDGGKPLVAAASFPLLQRRLSATAAGDFESTGGPAAGFGGGEDSYGFEESRGHVGCSTHLPTDLFADLRRTGLRPRMTGSVGLDSAFVAQGVFDGAINFSPHPWDNAAGALFAQAAGGCATDPDGNEWTLGARGLVVGTRQVHGTILDAVARLQD